MYSLDTETFSSTFRTGIRDSIENYRKVGKLIVLRMASGISGGELVFGCMLMKAPRSVFSCVDKCRNETTADIFEVQQPSYCFHLGIICTKFFSFVLALIFVFVSHFDL